MPDGDCVALKVDGIPFHTEGLAAPHPIESTKENGDFKFGAFGDFKKPVHFIGIVKVCHKTLLLWSFDLIGRITGD